MQLLYNIKDDTIKDRIVLFHFGGSVDKGLTPVFTLFPSDQVRLEFFKMGGGGLGSIAQAG